MDLVYIFTGLILLFISAEKMLSSSVVVARWLNVPEFFIGATIVALVTSLPEFITTVVSLWKFQNSSIAIGNIVGSNCANFGLVLPITVVFAKKKCLQVKWQFDVSFLFFVTLFFSLLIALNYLGLGQGILFTVLLGAYLWYKIYKNKNESQVYEHIMGLPPTIYEALLLILAPLGLFYGSEFLIQGSINIAQIFEIPDHVVGFTVIAIGTSLPEIITSVIALYKGYEDMAIGNAIGSNLLNILFVAGIPFIITPHEINASYSSLDSYVMVLLTSVLWIALYQHLKFQRLMALAMASLYFGYLGRFLI